MMLPRRTVLLLDDSRDFTELVTLVFAEAGLEVVAASDRVTALRLLADAQPEVIVIDQMLPGWDAHDAVREIRRLVGRDTSIVMLCLCAEKWLIGRAESAGVDEVLVLPYNFEDLLDRVERLCRARSR